MKKSNVPLKNGLPFTRLAPEKGKVCLGSDLAEVLAKSPLSSDEAKAWRRDLNRARKALKPPADKWQQSSMLTLNAGVGSR